MIHLDTNYLIGLLTKASPQASDVDGWLTAGQSLATSAIAWTEFLNGPVTPVEVTQVEAVLQSRIVAFGAREAALAADLFNRTGRKRGSRFDCLIAATAITAQAEVATANHADFNVFISHGLTNEALGRELLLAASIKLYELGRLSSGAAAELAGVPKPVFLAKLSDYGVCTFDLSKEELQREIALG